MTAVYKNVISKRDLITLVKHRPILWNKDAEGYRSKTFKDEAWKDVFKEMEPDYEQLEKSLQKKLGMEIMKKWSNIRDAYVKSKKNKRIRPYIYSDMLSFLDVTIQADDEEDQQLMDEDKGVNWFSDVQLINHLDDDENEPSSKRSKSNSFNHNISTTDDSVVSILANLLSKEEDEDKAFFNSILTPMKSLSDEDKIEFKIKVMKLLKIFVRKRKTSLKVEAQSSGSDNDEGQGEGE